jgi:Uma2 family endonuclease
MIIQQRLMTVEEFEAFEAQPENQDRLLELIDGEVVEKLPTQEHALIEANVAMPLNFYAHQTKSGRVGTNGRHRKQEDQHNSRLPDVSFDRTPGPLVRKGAVLHLPDLAVEIKSPDDSYNRMREKARYYLANGVKMVWLIFPEKRMVEVYAPDADVEILLEHETISGRDVLPGFTLAVRDVFKDPLEE